jgi:hypothetical protein
VRGAVEVEDETIDCVLPAEAHPADAFST